MTTDHGPPGATTRASHAPGGLADDVRRAIEWDVADRVLEFYARFDEWDYVGMLPMFADDGTWDRNGQVLTGHAQIAAMLDARPRAQVVRHVITNLRVTPSAATRASAAFYITAYRAEGLPAPGSVPRIRAPYLMLVGGADWVREGAWRMTRHWVRRAFEFDA